MQRVLSYFSRPYIIALTVLLLLGLALATWGFAQYLAPHFNPEANFPKNESLTSAARIANRGRLVVGVRNNVAPFGFRPEGEVLQGFDIDIARELARRWLSAGDEVAESVLELRVVNAADRIPLLVNHEVDLLIAAMPIQRDRDALIDFSRTYFEDSLGLLVRANSGIDGFASLRERQVAVLASSSAGNTIARESSAQEIALEIQEFDDFPQALDALSSGRVDAVAANRVALIQMAQGNPGLSVINTEWDRHPFSIGIPQGDSQMRAMVNFALEDLKRDGTYDELYQKWFGSTNAYVIPTSPGEWPQDLAQLAQESPTPPRNLLDEIRRRGYIKAGIPSDINPFGFQDEDAQWTGFDVDLVREFARRWLGDETAVELIPGEIYEHVDSLASGEIDLVAAGMIMRREWATTVDFSQSYVGPPVVNEPLGIAIPQDAPAFRELVNYTLQEMKLDGLYDTLHVRWFGAELPVYSVETWPGSADYLLAAYEDEEQPVRITAPRASTIKRIRQRGGILRVGTSEHAYPFSFLDESGQLGGFDIDLVTALAEEWGIEIDFVHQERSAQATQLLNGEVDLVAAGLTHTKQRETAMDFSQTYFMSGKNLLFRNDGAIAFDDAIALNENSSENDAQAIFSQLADAQIGVVGSLEANASAQALLDANNVAAELIMFESYDVALEQLRSHEIAALLGDDVRLAQIAEADSDFRRLAEPLTNEPYALGFASGDSYFQNLINGSLQTIKRQGIYDALHQKWFGPEIPAFAIELLPSVWPYNFDESPTLLDKPAISIVDQLASGRGREHYLSNGSAGNAEDKPKLVVGFNPNARPFSYVGDDNRPAGLEIELVRNLSARWLGQEYAVDFTPVMTSSVGTLLANGDVDLVIGGLAQLGKRQPDVDFSQTYYRREHSLLVSQTLLDEIAERQVAPEEAAGDVAHSPLDIDSNSNLLRAFDGAAIAVITNTNTLSYVQGLAEQQRLTLEIVVVEEVEQAIEALLSGKISGVAAPYPLLKSQADNHAEFVLVANGLAVEPFALGLPLYDERFRDLVNFTLQEMQLDGTLERLIPRWLGEEHRSAVEIWPGDSSYRPDLVPMAYIPKGQFVRGNADGFPDERTERVVMLDGYYIDQFEVTNRQYDRCVRAELCEAPRLPRSINFSHYFAQSSFGNYPVLWVSWHDSAAYCDFVGKRLPTEAEWERAARGPNERIYPWGDDIPIDQSNFDYIHKDVSPIGSFAQDVSGFGVYDMAGNVREWVSDWYEWDYYQKVSQTNPMGPVEGVTKVLRGGSWNDSAVYVRGTVRRNFLPESVDANLGFRCASSEPPLALQ